jgi:hypothetical protein
MSFSLVPEMRFSGGPLAHLWRYALQRNVFHGWYAESGVSLGAEEQKTAIGN